MALIDLTEIPDAHISSGMQDSFECFAADLLAFTGYEIIDRPGRGPDLGKDLIVGAKDEKESAGKPLFAGWLVDRGRDADRPTPPRTDPCGRSLPHTVLISDI